MDTKIERCLVHRSLHLYIVLTDHCGAKSSRKYNRLALDDKPGIECADVTIHCHRVLEYLIHCCIYYIIPQNEWTSCTGNSLQMCYIYIPVNNQLMLGFLTQGLSNKINNATQYNIL